ncbi:MAG: ribosome silencing factor [Cyclobacteriaceae bacterium]|jgi:ribosome-associated protein
MPVKKKQENSESLSKIIVEGMLEKKATDVLVMDLRGINGAFADFFILCNGNSDTQVDAISDSIEEYVENHIEEHVWHKEGHKNKEWILLDFVNVVANVFKKETRAYYKLEQLWGDAKLNYIDPSKQSEQ